MREIPIAPHFLGKSRHLLIPDNPEMPAYHQQGQRKSLCWQGCGGGPLGDLASCQFYVFKAEKSS
jgi:hypothetical protein